MKFAYSLAILGIGSFAWAQDRIQDLDSTVTKRVNSEIGSLVKFYEQLHRHPELAFQEEQTAAKLANELRSLGFEVTTKVGDTGIVGVLKNGPGPTIMVRTDMDGLPIIEKTGLPFASQVRIRDKEGREVGTMHACGHDVHMTSWVGAARVLVGLKDRWKGTLVFIGQPAEEIGGGARRMLEDGLFKRFPRPDAVFGLHCHSSLPIGMVGYSEGLLLANVDSVDITILGKGGHGSAPQTTIDPIVIASRLVLDLQTLVSRENNPQDPAVVTVGSFHGGSKHNIIPSDVHLQLTVRSFKDEVRKNLLEGIERMAKAAAASARAPEPIMKIDTSNFTPALYNDAGLAKKTAKRFAEHFGDTKVRLIPPIMGGEDFARYGQQGVPIFFWFIGTVDPAKFQESKKPGGASLPSIHSDTYAPVAEPSIRVGATSMSLAVLNALNEKK
jgi:hippurate hydrolase